MLALLILAAVVVVAALAVLASRRMTRDDEHSVAGYHRQLHTLEQIKTHTVESEPGEAGAQAAAGKPSYPESALRLSGSPYVRVTDGPNAMPPPAVPPPPVADVDGVVTFDDAKPLVVPSGRAAGASETFSFGRKDRAMDSMNRRPRRLGGPIVAVVAVLALIAVLVIAGSHKVPPAKKHLSSTGTTGTSSRSQHVKKHHTQHGSTTTTTLPLVSLPKATSLHDATYTTSLTDYALVVSATTGRCYVEVNDVSTGATLYAAVMNAGQQETINVTGPVTIDVGAPSVFAASVNGVSMVLPYGYETPFNLHLVPAGSVASTGVSTTTSTSTSTSTTTTTLPG